MRSTVILADDQEVYRVGIQNILEQNLDVRVKEHFLDLNEATEYLADGQEADLILFKMDLSLTKSPQLLTYLNKEFPEIKKLAIIHHFSETTRDFCINLGLKGFIKAECTSETLLECVVEILKGNSYYQEYEQKGESCTQDFYLQIEQEYDLTKREIEILKLILHQYENDEISKKLNLSPLTIKTHRRNIFKKLKIRNLAGMVWLINNYKDLNRIF